MHVVIGLITAVAGLLFALAALERSGWRWSTVNPCAAYRRLTWRKKYAGGALSALRDPVDAVAVLLVGMAKCEGEMSAAQKRKIREVIQMEFGLTADQAHDQVVAASFLTKDQVYIVDKLDAILGHMVTGIDARQKTLLMGRMKEVGTIDGPLNTEQRRLLDATALTLGT